MNETEEASESESSGILEEVAGDLSSLPPDTRKRLELAFEALCGDLWKVPRAKLESKAESIKAEGRAKDLVVMAAAEEAAKQLQGDSELVQRALRHFGSKIVGEQHNRESVFSRAIGLLRGRSARESSAGELEADWIHKFWDIAGKTTDSDMQGLLARILAGEVECPGSFSASTVFNLSLLSRRVAKLFEKLCNMSFRCGPHTRVILYIPSYETANSSGHTIGSSKTRNEQFKEFGLNHQALLELQSAGLLANMPEEEFPPLRDLYANVDLEYAGQPAKIDASVFLDKWKDYEEDPKERGLRCGVVSLTRAGNEVRSLLSLSPDPQYTKALRELFEKSNIKLILMQGDS